TSACSTPLSQPPAGRARRSPLRDQPAAYPARGPQHRRGRTAVYPAREPQHRRGRTSAYPREDRSITHETTAASPRRGTAMKPGPYTAGLHDSSLPETLKILREPGLPSAEVNAGGFIPAPHLPVDQLLSGSVSPADYLGQFDQAGITLTGLNVNGNPLNPDPEVGPKHAEDLRRAITLASLLGVGRVVTMSGLPAAHQGGRAAS